MENLKAKIVKFTVIDGKEDIYFFEAYEFSNGLILVPHADSSDEFFEDTYDTEFGFDYQVLDWEDTNKFFEITKLELTESIEGSIDEYGEDAVPKKYLELVQDPCPKPVLIEWTELSEWRYTLDGQVFDHEDPEFDCDVLSCASNANKRVAFDKQVTSSSNNHGLAECRLLIVEADKKYWLDLLNKAGIKYQISYPISDIEVIDDFGYGAEVIKLSNNFYWLEKA